MTPMHQLSQLNQLTWQRAYSITIIITIITTNIIITIITTTIIITIITTIIIIIIIIIITTIIFFITFAPSGDCDVRHRSRWVSVPSVSSRSDTKNM
ncbi:unnamed protein product [Gadus morhua 'NCC']